MTTPDQPVWPPQGYPVPGYGQTGPPEDPAQQLRLKPWSSSVAHQQAGVPTRAAQEYWAAGSLEPAVVVLTVCWVATSWFDALWDIAGVATGSMFSSGWTAGSNVIGIVALLAVIGVYVSTGAWLSKAHQNADLIAPSREGRWSRPWVWWSWLVPVVNFWFPKQVVDDIWRTTVKTDRTPTAVWWGTWIAQWMLLWICMVAVFVALVENYGGVFLIAVWLSVIAHTVAAFFWIRVVRTISKAQDALATIGAPGPGVLGS